MARRSTKISTEGKPWARYLRLSKAEAEEVKGLTKEQRLELTNRKLDDQLDALNGWLDAKGLPYDEAHVYRGTGPAVRPPRHNHRGVRHPRPRRGRPAPSRPAPARGRPVVGRRRHGAPQKRIVPRVVVHLPPGRLSPIAAETHSHADER